MNDQQRESSDPVAAAHVESQRVSFLRRLLVVTFFAVALFTVSAAAQEPSPAQLRWLGLDRGEPVQLTLGWRFHGGDDPRRSDPAFDDSGWEIVPPQMPSTARPRGGWRGVGWFRRHVTFDEALRMRDVVLSVSAPGRASVYLDGVLVLDTREDATRRRGPGTADRYAASTTIRFERPRHVLAVRYECECRGPGDQIGFTLSIERVEASATRAGDLRRQAMIGGALTAVPAVLGALHLALFIYYRPARENLYCALCMFSLALIVGGSLIRFDRVVSQVLTFSGVVGATFFGILTYALLRTGRLPRTWKLFAVAGVLVILVIPWLDDHSQNILWVTYFAASIVEVVRIEIRRDRGCEPRQSAMPLLVGMILLDVAIVAQILTMFDIIPDPFGIGDIYLFGILAFSLSTSLFVARSFARTSMNLERRLDEVQTLSAQVIATERESARRGLEIEAARTLQRAILPSSVPQFASLEIAASVTTASEVGGDYYDFREVAEDAVIIALGDAAGHGVAAGTMVTATKALFSSMAGEEDLNRILTQCDRVLRQMNVRPLHMCLLLARVTPRGMTVCSAAMPRPLRFVSATQRVEEIEVGGLPLAASLGSSWSTMNVALAPGDVLLFASDGLAEALSPAGEPLGYDGVAARFGEAALRSNAEGIVDALLDAARRWRGTRAQDDDIALVAVKIHN